MLLLFQNYILPFNYSYIQQSYIKQHTYSFQSRSPPNRTFGHHFLLKFIVRNGTIFVLVHAVHYLGDVLGVDEIASGLDHFLELVQGESAVLVYVKGVECFEHVEHWTALQPLAQGFAGAFYFEMGAPHLAEVGSCIGKEAVVSTVTWMSAHVWISAIHRLRMVDIHGQECFTELRECNSSIA